MLNSIHKDVHCGAMPIRRPIPSIYTGLGILLFSLCSYALDNETENGKNLRNVVVEGYRANVARLKLGRLAWTHLTEVKGEPDRRGEHKLWWNGEKIATEYTQDHVCPTPDGTFGVERSGQRSAYDGKEFRVIPIEEGLKTQQIALLKEPDFRLYENWFETARLAGRGAQWNMIEDYEKLDHVTIKWEIAQLEGKSLIAFRLRVNDTGERIDDYYDPSTACGLVRQEWYDSQGRLYSLGVTEWRKVGEDTWFPVLLDMKSWEPDNGNVLSVHNLFQLDLEKSSFNNSSAVPEEIFEIPVTPDMEVTDRRGGAKIKYNGAILLPENVEMIDTRVEEFVAGATDTIVSGTNTRQRATGAYDVGRQIRRPHGRLLGFGLTAVGLVLLVLGIYTRRRLRAPSDNNVETEESQDRESTA